MTATDILNEFGPTAIDYLVAWSKADARATLAATSDEQVSAFVERRTIQSNIRALANRIEARRLAELAE